jgi:hypothetical protein
MRKKLVVLGVVTSLIGSGVVIGGDDPGFVARGRDHYGV